MIKEFKVGERRYGIIEGATHSIITETDCCHSVEPNGSTVEIAAGFNEYRFVSVNDAIAQAQPIDDLPRWIHYFGIKPRVHGNYDGLLASMREIGVDTSAMPKW